MGTSDWPGFSSDGPSFYKDNFAGLWNTDVEVRRAQAMNFDIGKNQE